LIFARLKLSIVAGQILGGMIVGPYVLGIVVEPLVLNELSQVGVVLLLFIIGLQLDPAQLRRMLVGITSLTLLEIGVSFAFGFLASYLLRFNLIESIIFSMAASISSTAIIGRILLSRRMLQSPESGFIMGLNVIEDMIAVIFLILLSAITSSNTVGFPYFIIGNSLPSIGFFATLEAIIGGLALVGLAYVVSHYVAPRIINYLTYYEEEYEEIPFLFALGLGFLFAAIAALLGYSPGTGAFIVGLSIRGKQSKFLVNKITPIKDLFLVLFFVSMGGLIDPSPAFSIGWPIILVFALLVMGKFVGGYSIGRILNFANRNFKLKTLRDARKGTFTIEGGISSPAAFGAWLVPRGEFSLIIGQLALALGLVGQTFFSLVGVSVLITTTASSVIQRFTEPRRASSIYSFKEQKDPEE